MNINCDTVRLVGTECHCINIIRMFLNRLTFLVRISPNREHFVMLKRTIRHCLLLDMLIVLHFAMNVVIRAWIRIEDFKGRRTHLIRWGGCKRRMCTWNKNNNSKNKPLLFKLRDKYNTQGYIFSRKIEQNLLKVSLQTSSSALLRSWTKRFYIKDHRCTRYV